VTFYLYGLGGNIEPSHLRGPAGWSDHPGEHTERGGLAGAVRAQEADDLSAWNVEGKLVDSDLRAEAFGQAI
jgi:hypothetical protein